VALNLAGGVGPCLACFAVLWCGQTDAGGEVFLTPAFGWTGLLLVYGVALSRTSAMAALRPVHLGGGLTCPNCGERAFSMAQKLTLSPVSSMPCESCGEALTISILLYTVVPVLGATGGLALFFQGNGRTALAAGVVLIGVLSAIWIMRRAPVVRA
jgi:predicted RNA-binding Zn-ribbon protein involved in translation (DUF1610 family)